MEMDRCGCSMDLLHIIYILKLLELLALETVIFNN